MLTMSNSNLKFIVIIILILFKSAFALAWPPTYGAEFEFFHPKLTWDDKSIRSESALQAKKEFMHSVYGSCSATPGCRVETVNGKFTPDFKVTLANGWWFKVSHDPAVIEVLTKPSPVSTASFTENLEMSKISASAATISPASRSITSSGTTSCAKITACLPSRITLALGTVISCKAKIAVSARYS